MKRPAFQFYPADWLNKSELQSCGIGARGLWMQLLCLMHNGDPYGHLTINGKAMTETQGANLTHVQLSTYRKLLAELDGAGVCTRNVDGCFYSRRMVRDERLRNARAACGQLGGNPNLLGDKVNQTSNQKPRSDKNKVKVKPTPSSSSSSSSKSDVVVTPTVDARAKAGKNGAIEKINGSKTKQTSRWSANAASINATAATLGITRHPHEDDASWKDRVIATVNAKFVSDERKASRGSDA